jgi:hypothetical protein
MTEIRQWVGDFDLGQFLGIGLDTTQIGYLAGTLFLSLFALLALRRASHAAGILPGVWIAVAVGFVAGALLTAARGFPAEVPDNLRPWIEPEKLLRLAAVVALLGFSMILLSAHWVGRRWSRIMVRAIGLASTGLALWLAAGWFANDLPDEARPWAARAVVTRFLAVAGLILLAGAFWFRPANESPHRQWVVRTLAAPLAALAVVFILRWFGRTIWDEIPIAEVAQVVVVLTAIATGICGLIAAGAYVLRDRPRCRPVTRRTSAVLLPVAEATTDQPLPIAIRLDDDGHPVLPVRLPHSGSAGA